MDLQPLEQHVLGLCAYDDVGVWRVMARVSSEGRRMYPLPPEVRTTALEAIRVLLEAGLIEAGNPNGPTFKAIPGTPSDVLAYIDRGLDELGRVIGPADVCWFRATPAGKELAKELQLKGW